MHLHEGAVYMHKIECVNETILWAPIGAGSARPGGLEPPTF